MYFPPRVWVYLSERIEAVGVNGCPAANEASINTHRKIRSTVRKNILRILKETRKKTIGVI